MLPTVAVLQEFAADVENCFSCAFGAEAFDVVIASPQLAGMLSIAGDIRTAHDDDWQSGKAPIVSKVFKDVEAIHARHLQIQNQEIGFGKERSIRITILSFQIFYDLVTVPDLIDAVWQTAAFDRTLKEKEILLVVFRDKNKTGLWFFFVLLHENQKEPP